MGSPVSVVVAEMVMQNIEEQALATNTRLRPTAVNSKFGWLLSGPTESIINQETTVTNLTIAGNNNSLFYYAQDTLVYSLKTVLGDGVNWNHGSFRNHEVA